MFGNKLRSWMEAVRPRKKQQRKEKQKSNSTTNGKHVTLLKQTKPYTSENEILADVEQKTSQTMGNHAPRYSGTNLSSPESAYSTGYSTDGTSPGAPPEYYINIRTGTKYFPSGSSDKDNGRSIPLQTNNISSCFNENYQPQPVKSKTSPRHSKSPKKDHTSTVAVRLNGESTTISMSQDVDNCKNIPARTSVTFQNNLNQINGISPRVTEVVVNSGITSPRQRNRIRTNPWLPGNNLSPCTSNIGLHVKGDNVKQAIPISPLPIHYLNLCSPSKKYLPSRESTSSSCSSLSAASLHWDTNLIGPNSGSEEDDDCTLNEMMGKFDESYVYEKETDILSDSDPTDCDTDIDTGQDGGDEEEPLEREFDFIDNGSYLEFNTKDERNTGHCTYYNFEVHRKSSRRRTSKRFKETQKQGRRRSVSSKQKPKIEQKSYLLPQVDGSKSAGATPVSVRRIKYPVSKLALEDHLKKRSNSVSFGRNAVVSTFDQRDKEADKKYKELIVEAEHMLMSMKHGGLSPRRLPGPANKRVELLRTESTKPDVFNKNRLIDDVSNLHLSKIPSTFVNTRYSPKRNHITNFINNNSPVHIRREAERERPIEKRGNTLSFRKDDNHHLATLPKSNSPGVRRKYNKSEVRRSPKYRKKISKTLSLRKNDVSSSDSEREQSKHRLNGGRNSEHNGFICPQSEPVKRKVYSHQSKTVAFNLNYESVYNLEHRNSNENLRQQVLLNTIANLKKSLEDQSASLKQVYSSTHDVQL